MFVVSLRTMASITLAKRFPVGLWTYQSWTIRGQHSRTLRMKKKMTPGGITIQTDTHGEDVDVATMDDD